MKFLTLDNESDISINDLPVRKVEYCMQNKYMNIYDTDTLELIKLHVGDRLEDSKILSLERFYRMLKDMPILNNRVSQVSEPMCLHGGTIQFDFDSIALKNGSKAHWDLDYSSVYARYGGIRLLAPYFCTAGVRWVQVKDGCIVVRFDIQPAFLGYVDIIDETNKFGDIYYNDNLEVVKAKLNSEDIFVKGRVPKKTFARLCIAGSTIDVRNIREIYAKECEEH